MATRAGKRTRTITAGKTARRKSKALRRKAQPKTLVTGGTGFLGRHLISRLIDGGGRNLRVLATSAPAWLIDAGIETISGSITDADVVSRAVEGVEEIYHLAGRVSLEPEDAREMYAIHVDGTRTLCDAARLAGVKTIVMASTSGTLAVTETGKVTPDETYQAPLDIISRWPYYASKFYQEQTALERFSGKGLRLAILNPSLLLGPGDERLSSTKLILDFLAQKIKAIPGGGLSFVDVRDAAGSFIEAMASGRHGERYLLGSANWSFREFFGRLERLTKIRAPFVALPSGVAIAGAQIMDGIWRHWNLTPPLQPLAVEMSEYFWYLECSKAKQELGFAPRDPGETLQETIVYIRQHFIG